ncbi:MAG: FHA domain-containing protein, partial [Myxococcales bacterium]|nr:FHA domain-containing protein [Myxococcales bacterium]
MATLVDIQTGERIHLQTRNTVGRSSKCEVCLPNPNISAEHALIWWDGSHWWIQDGGSRNGTSVDGRDLERGIPSKLAVGMHVMFAQRSAWKVESIAPPLAEGIPVMLQPMPTAPQPGMATAGALDAEEQRPLSVSLRTKAIHQARRMHVSNVRVTIGAAGFFEIVFDLDCREAFRYDDYWNAAWIFLKYNPAEHTPVTGQQDLIDKLVRDNAERRDVGAEIARIKA